ncbi:hypothetical protein [Bacteroides sp. 519]|uniref:hypothetical protein n=1 Tax=Bacteroides sp. 519 TaxID=2302937 RepID=UPI0013D220D3|nr:hypothetical protein [Bacteroides sp. 519]NDV58058.1 hypothetical protein [Bacteroides sp. 519]
MNPQSVAILITALGGLEAIKWLFNTLLHRKANARKEDASANAAEIQNLLSVIENLNTQIERYDDRLKQRDDKVDAIYRDWRNAQSEVQTWIQKYHELELQWKEAEVRRCNVRGCANRMPPSEY